MTMAQQITKCRVETNHAQVAGTNFCRCTHVMYDAEVKPEHTPKRIQRKRTKGWKMPEGAVYVGRPTAYGNPWKVGIADPDITAERAVELFRLHRATMLTKKELKAIRGKDLACWCPLDQPCHADVLLEIANAEKTA